MKPKANCLGEQPTLEQCRVAACKIYETGGAPWSGRSLTAENLACIYVLCRLPFDAVFPVDGLTPQDLMESLSERFAEVLKQPGVADALETIRVTTN